MKKLYRTTDGKIFFGVCAGIGDYFSIDPIFFRIFFLALSVLIYPFLGIGLYLLTALMTPMEKKTKV
jgi:phage shock protein C